MCTPVGAPSGVGSRLESHPHSIACATNVVSSPASVFPKWCPGTAARRPARPRSDVSRRFGDEQDTVVPLVHVHAADFLERVGVRLARAADDLRRQEPLLTWEPVTCWVASPSWRPIGGHCVPPGNVFGDIHWRATIDIHHVDVAAATGEAKFAATDLEREPPPIG